MKTTQELNALRYRARNKSRRRTQTVYALTLVTCTMLAVSLYSASPIPLLIAVGTSMTGLYLAYRGERLENEYRAAVYASRNPNQK